MNQKIHKSYQAIMILIAIFWLIAAVARFITHADIQFLFMAVLMCINGGLFILFAFINLEKLLHKLVTFAFLLANIALTIADQFGLPDLIILLFNILALTLFIILHNQTKNKKKE